MRNAQGVGQQRRSWKRTLGRCGLWVVAVFVAMLFAEEVLTRVYPFPQERLPSEADLARSIAELGEFPPTLVSALLVAEDRRFWSHRGVDAWACLRQGIQLFAGRPGEVGAAETISMRVVRDLLPGTGEAGWANRLVQMFRARQLERLLDKRQILSEFCARTRCGARRASGLAGAARRWFGVEPRDLEPVQAATLVAALREGGRTGLLELRRRRDRLLRTLWRRGALGLDRYRAAVAQPLEPCAPKLVLTAASAPRR